MSKKLAATKAAQLATKDIGSAHSIFNRMIASSAYRDLDPLQQLKKLVRLDDALGKISVDVAFEIGRRLRTYRDAEHPGKSDHGNWRKYVEESIGLHYRRACRYMSIFDCFKTLETLRAFEFANVDHALLAVRYRPD